MLPTLKATKGFMMDTIPIDTYRVAREVNKAKAVGEIQIIEDIICIAKAKAAVLNRELAKLAVEKLDKTTCVGTRPLGDDDEPLIQAISDVYSEYIVELEKLRIEDEA